MEFDTCLPYTGKTGQIVEIFFDGQFVVSTSDNMLMVTDYEGHETNDEHFGHYMRSAGTPREI